MDFGPMRWLTVRVPGDDKTILLEKPRAAGPRRGHGRADPRAGDQGCRRGWLAFTTDDVEAAFTRVKESGADITQDVVTQPYGRDFALRDPFGNHIRIGEVY